MRSALRLWRAGGDRELQHRRRHGRQYRHRLHDRHRQRAARGYRAGDHGGGQHDRGQRHRHPSGAVGMRRRDDGGALGLRQRRLERGHRQRHRRHRGDRALGPDLLLPRRGEDARDRLLVRRRRSGRHRCLHPEPLVCDGRAAITLARAADGPGRPAARAVAAPALSAEHGLDGADGRVRRLRTGVGRHGDPRWPDRGLGRRFRRRHRCPR